MQTVLIVIHLMVVVALVAVVLLQRSEGGALGVGGGSGFMTGRGQANVLTRATAILATIFFLTSLGLTLIARYGHGGGKLNFDNIAPGQSEPAPANLPPKGQGSVLDQLRDLEQQRSGGAPAGGATSPSGPAGATSPASPAPAAGSTPSSPVNPSAAKPAPSEPSGMPERVTPKAEQPATPSTK